MDGSREGASEARANLEQAFARSAAVLEGLEQPVFGLPLSWRGSRWLHELHHHDGAASTWTEGPDGGRLDVRSWIERSVVVELGHGSTADGIEPRLLVETAVRGEREAAPSTAVAATVVVDGRLVEFARWEEDGADVLWRAFAELEITTRLRSWPVAALELVSVDVAAYLDGRRQWLAGLEPE